MKIQEILINMQKKILYILLIIIIFSNILLSQKYDYNWIIGQVRDESKVEDFVYLNNKNLIHFNDSKIDYIKGITSVHSKMSAYNLTASDSLGNLIFYFNGLKFFNRNNMLMTNGDSIGFFLNKRQMQIFYKTSPCLAGDDYENKNYTQKFIPFPGHKNQYLVFFTHVNQNLSIEPPSFSRLIYVRIDMNLSNGLGTVVERRKLMIDGLVEGASLVKHANGVDWWLVTSAYRSNIYYVFLISSKGMTGPKKQIIAPNFKFQPLGLGSLGDSNYSKFSPDGKIFAKIQRYSNLILYNFDRCTGELQYFRKISTGFQFYQISFSPNSRYIYFVSWGNIYQIDLDDPNGKCTMIAPIRTLHYLENGPDDKIYFSLYRTKYMGYINRPNNKGLACDVRTLAFKTPYPKHMILPQYPNYRLSRQKNANCPELDSIFLPVEDTVKYKVENKEYISADRYRILIDSSYYEQLKISE